MGFLDGKTEAPTQKKRDDAKKKGQVAKSRDIISVLVLIAGFQALRHSAPQFYGLLHEQMIYYLSVATMPDRHDALQQAPVRLVADTISLLIPLLISISVAALIGNLMQTGPMLIGEPLKVDFSKLNPQKGLKRIISPTSLAELIKASAKVGVVGWQVSGWLRETYPRLLAMAQMDLLSASSFGGRMIGELVWRTIWVLLIIALLDYTWQRFQHESQLKMTRQEVRDEMRQMEGSPEIRGAIRRRQREMLRGRMLGAVATADVVVTNPTHYAVALKYDHDTMDAPEVVALGQRLIALRIRELAKEHDVPIVENPPLARSLFAACDIGSSIPGELYAAVAEILAYVYRLRGKAI